MARLELDPLTVVVLLVKLARGWSFLHEVGGLHENHQVLRLIEVFGEQRDELARKSQLVQHSVSYLIFVTKLQLDVGLLERRRRNPDRLASFYAKGVTRLLAYFRVLRKSRQGS